MATATAPPTRGMSIRAAQETQKSMMDRMMAAQAAQAEISTGTHSEGWAPLCFLFFVFCFPHSLTALEAPGPPLSERSKTLRPEEASEGPRAREEGSARALLQ